MRMSEPFPSPQIASGAGAAHGDRVNGWHREWEQSGELRRRHPAVGSYIRAGLQEIWESSPRLRAEYADRFHRFMSDAKKAAAEMAAAGREKRAQPEEAERDVFQRTTDHLIEQAFNDDRSEPSAWRL